MKKIILPMLAVIALAGCQSLSTLREDSQKKVADVFKRIGSQVSATADSLKKKFYEAREAAREVKEAAEEINEAVEAVKKVGSSGQAAGEAAKEKSGAAPAEKAPETKTAKEAPKPTKSPTLEDTK